MNLKYLTSRDLIITDPSEIVCIAMVSGEISRFWNMVGAAERQKKEFINIGGLRMNSFETVLIGVVTFPGFESEFEIELGDSGRKLQSSMEEAFEVEFSLSEICGKVDFLDFFLTGGVGEQPL